MPASPLAPPDPTGPSARVLYWDEEEELILTGHSDDDLERYVTGIWREAHRLALLAHGTVTSLARALFQSGHDAARGHAEAMLPRSRNSVVLQNDLTAVVTGTPSAGLLALLDAGYGPEDLIARLTEAAEGDRVPQTLTYLVEDVARRHGRLQVRPAGCCLCSDDETLLTEILNTRSLRALALVRLAPTVLVSAKPQADTPRRYGRGVSYARARRSGDDGTKVARPPLSPAT